MPPATVYAGSLLFADLPELSCEPLKAAENHDTAGRLQVPQRFIPRGGAP